MSYKITEECQHDIVHVKVVQSTTTCETTVEVCELCGKEVTEPKTDCR